MSGDETKVKENLQLSAIPPIKAIKVRVKQDSITLYSSNVNKLT